MDTVRLEVIQQSNNVIVHASIKAKCSYLLNFSALRSGASASKRKFDHGLTQIFHDDLHWLDLADRATY